MKSKTLLKQHIDEVQDRLWKFAEGRAYDSGVRWVEMEYYLKGLEKAQRLVNKQKKFV